MNQKTIVWGIVVLVILALGAWYLSSSGASSTGTQGETATTTTTTGTTGTPAGTPATTNTFKSIFTQSGNHQCDYSQSNSTGQSTSVIYIADGKMRGEFRSTMSGASTASLMIYSGGYLYSWKEGATTGKKSSIRALADLPDVIPQDLTSGAIYGTSANTVGWNCHDWLKDVKLFTIPTYVTFS
ncbi:MAG: hypothetical protein AAB480_03660 [Patescibacteria group bacterium]